MELKKIKITHEERSYEGNYTADIDRIVLAMRVHGYDCDKKMATRLWTIYSDSHAASWLTLPKDDATIVECLFPYFDII